MVVSIIFQPRLEFFFFFIFLQSRGQNLWAVGCTCSGQTNQIFSDTDKAHSNCKATLWLQIKMKRFHIFMLIPCEITIFSIQLSHTFAKVSESHSYNQKPLTLCRSCFHRSKISYYYYEVICSHFKNHRVDHLCL